jgi:hypothetical protein
MYRCIHIYIYIYRYTAVIIMSIISGLSTGYSVSTNGSHRHTTTFGIGGPDHISRTTVITINTEVDGDDNVRWSLTIGNASFTCDHDVDRYTSDGTVEVSNKCVNNNNETNTIQHTTRHSRIYYNGQNKITDSTVVTLTINTDTNTTTHNVQFSRNSGADEKTV